MSEIIHLDAVDVLYQTASFGKIIQPTNSDEMLISMIFGNKDPKEAFDQYHALAIYMYYKRMDVTEKEYNSPLVYENFVRVQSCIKNDWKEYARFVGEKINKDHMNAILEKNKQMLGKHAAGTTKEIAAMLGVSLSEVRRLKASGELEAAISMHESRKYWNDSVAKQDTSHLDFSIEYKTKE